MKDKNLHRPIIIEGLENPLNKDEIAQIKALYGKIKPHFEALAMLNHEYRRIIGYEHCDDVDFVEQWFDDSGHVGLDDLLNFAKEERLRWAKERLSGTD